MKLQILTFFFCLAIFSLISCDGTPEENNEKIDKTADSAKDLICLLYTSDAADE